MKELKDYLHLYSGCDVQTIDGIGKLIGIVKDESFIDYRGYENKGYVDEFGNEYGFALLEEEYFVKDIKPVLYPLSVINKPYPFKFHKNTVIPLEYISTSKADSQQIMRRIENNQSIDVFEFWKIQRLLELRFDIFGLIKAGLAIDKTTLN